MKENVEERKKNALGLCELKGLWWGTTCDGSENVVPVDIVCIEQLGKGRIVQ